MKTTLTIEQSKHLIRLGIDYRKASAYSDSDIHNYPFVEPLFTLNDLLELLPKTVDSNVLSVISVQCVVGTDDVTDGWTATYVAEDMISAYGGESLCSASELIDALYKLLCWVIKHTITIKAK